MKLCFSTLGCPDWSWEDIVSTAKDLGYHGVELRGVQKETYMPRVAAFSPGRIKQTMQRLELLGLEVPCMTSASELFNPDGYEDMIFATQEYIDVASEAKTPYVRVLGDRNIAPGAVIDDERVIDAAQRLGDYAAERGVTLLIESNGAYAQSERLAKVLQKIDNPGVAALWDVHHPYRFNSEPPEATFENLKDYVRHVHLKDSVVKGDGKIKYRVAGAGDLPLSDMVEVLESGGYEGYYSLEWVKRWDLSLEEPGIAFASYVQFMRRLG